MSEESKGLGDSVEKIIHAVGDNLDIKFIRKRKGCSGCRKRKEALNKMFPYKTEEKAKEKDTPCTDCEEKKKKKQGGCNNCGKNK
tara:strand:+ start:4014 stop:4268 length:255 start_codon:yes stop_codon:yes gene_type:complete